MKTIHQITQCRDDMRRILDQVQSIKHRVAAEETRITADASRHEGYRREKISEAREKAMAELGKPIGELRARAREVQAELPNWRQTQFVLSRQQFVTGDAALENVTRMRHFGELRAMPPALLRMTYAHAKQEANLALVYQCMLANEGGRDRPGWKGLNLHGLVIPEQQQALELISECAMLPPTADRIVGEVSGRIAQGAENLISARAMTASPIEPTLHFEEESEAAGIPMAEDPINLAAGSAVERMTAARVKEAA